MAQDPALLIYQNLPGVLPAPHISNSAVLLRHFISWRFKKLLQLNAETLGEKNLRFCNCHPTPAQGRRKDGSFYDTGMPGHIQIHAYDDASKIAELGEQKPTHAYVGLKRCSSPMRCPACGARIRYVRREEVQKVSNIMIKHGFSYLFVTLTAPHNVDTDPKEFISKFQEANREMKKTDWKKFKEEWGLAYYVRSIEVTDDKPGPGFKTGVHFHSHTVNFCERPAFTAAEASTFRDELAAKWVAALLKVGLITESEKEKTFKHGVDVQRPKVKEQGELSDPALIQKLVEYISKGAAFELSPGTIGGKSGRKDKRISHWELMRIALTERPDLQPRLLNIIQALKGLAHMQYSRGLRDFCGLKEVTDEQIMRGEADTMIYAFDTDEKETVWKTVKKFGQQKILLTALEDHDVETVIDIIRFGADPISGELLSEPPKLE